MFVIFASQDAIEWVDKTKRVARYGEWLHEITIGLIYLLDAHSCFIVNDSSVYEQMFVFIIQYSLAIFGLFWSGCLSKSFP